ncbi:MAG: hypothetical protein LUC90_08990 [Lachnospiraceae bacterium]|nr:hypothetical protein [Lachnospiraceae bacterium]
MKKTKWKHLLRTIKKNGVSFFAVSFIAATSIAIFLGLQSAGTAILREASNYYINNKLETLEISCANGITQEDIEAIAAWDGVDLVEGGYTTTLIMDGEEEKIILQALSLCSEMNVATVIEGTLPTGTDQAAVEETFAEKQGIQVGDVITLEHDGELLSDTFEITAIINMPSFSCASLQDSRGRSDVGLGSASYYIAVALEAFDSSYYDDCFTTAYVRNNALDELYYYSTAYTEQETAFKEMVEELGAERAELRYQSLSGDADSEIADAQAEIDDGQTEIDDAEAEIADAESEIRDAQAQINDGQAQIDASQAQIDAAEAQIAASQTELDAATQAMQAQVAAGLVSAQAAEAALAENTAQLEAAKTQLNAQKAALADAQEELAQKKQELASARAQLADKQQELEDAKTELEDARTELADAKAELADKKQELEDAKTDLAEAKEELEDARVELADAEEEVADLELKDWIVSVRNDVGDVRGVETIVESIYGLSYSMSIIFLLVAVVVCYAAITRMIDEQRALIGAQKALGFTSGEILKHYMEYNTLCAILGFLQGWLSSVVIVEILVLHIFTPKFLLGSVPLIFDWKGALLTAAICLVIFLASTYVACAKLVRLPATTLLRGEVPVREKPFFFVSSIFENVPKNL